MAKTRRIKRKQPIAAPPQSIARRLSSKLGAVPSMAWGGFYLLLIPFFAGIYTLLPAASFYHSTMVHDAQHKEERRIFIADVETWARLQMTPRLLDAIERVEAKRPKKLEYYADYTPEQFWPVLLVDAEFENGKNLHYWFWLGGMVHVVMTRDLDIKPDTITVERTEGFDLSADCEEEQKDAAIEGVCRSQLVEDQLKPDNFFGAPERIKEPVYRLRTEAAGYNRGVTFHAFGRMLYLSAVTVTTVGYGDIVPLTDAARAAVALEGIGGIVLIGLFLNALAHEHQSSKALYMESQAAVELGRLESDDAGSL